MRRFFLISSFLTLFAIGSSAQWKPAGDKIKTDWASQINPANVLPEYPRPIMERSDWKNLNGLWNYAVINKGEHLPAEFEGQILVPFAIESSLSGVGKRINENQELVYQRSFDIPSAWKGKQVLLHFGAVDWKTDVWVNDVKVGSHTGGFTPFSFDITAALSGKGNNQLVVKVWDPTDKGPQPRGKQVSNPEGIWYTPVSGIWQTVWMEPVAGKHIENLRITPDIDRNLLTVKAELNSACPSDFVEVNVYDGNQLVATGKSINAEPVEVSMPRNAKLWSPDSPFLYTLKVTLKSGGKVVDKVDSYAAMRKYSTRRDADGIVRLELNNEALFQFGPLDQGWWPDGLYTAPTDEALLYDVQKTKDFGFNMIRKHIKVEPMRWYYHCDRLGLLVWQDMPNGGGKYHFSTISFPLVTGVHHRDDRYRKFARESRQGREEYRAELREMITQLESVPSIVLWVPFNEGWGQFDAADACRIIRSVDESRPIDHASGWHDQKIGDLQSLHVYFRPYRFRPDKLGRAVILSEFGGYNLRLEGHCWNDVNYGYKGFSDREALWQAYRKLMEEQILPAIPRGLCAAVYTQLTDVEDELNGIMTYDRRVVKLPEDPLRELNRRLLEAGSPMNETKKEK